MSSPSSSPPSPSSAPPAPPRVTCEEVITFLLDYLSGELPEEKTASFEHHLGGCKSCIAYLHTYRETVRLSRTALGDAENGHSHISGDLIRAIVTAAREEKASGG